MPTKYYTWDLIGIAPKEILEQWWIQSIQITSANLFA